MRRHINYIPSFCVCGGGNEHSVTFTLWFRGFFQVGCIIFTISFNLNKNNSSKSRKVCRKIYKRMKPWHLNLVYLTLYHTERVGQFHLYYQWGLYNNKSLYETVFNLLKVHQTIYILVCAIADIIHLSFYLYVFIVDKILIFK